MKKGSIIWILYWPSKTEWWRHSSWQIRVKFKRDKAVLYNTITKIFMTTVYAAIIRYILQVGLLHCKYCFLLLCRILKTSYTLPRSNFKRTKLHFQLTTKTLLTKGNHKNQDELRYSYEVWQLQIMFQTLRVVKNEM